MSTFDAAAFLPDDLLERIRERAAVHDRENTFPQQDLDELKDAGYLSVLVPAELGGAGLGLEQAALLQLLVATVCEMTHKVLPGMVERRFGRIVNVASLAGLIPGPAGHTLYGASKSFLVKFSQSLHLENLNTGVHVSALCPGLTYSEFHDVNGTRGRLSAATPEWLWMGSDEVAAVGYEAAEANRAVCVTGAPNKAIAPATAWVDRS